MKPGRVVAFGLCARLRVLRAALGLLLVGSAARAGDSEAGIRPLSEALVVDGAGCLDAQGLAEQVGDAIRSATVDARLRIVVREELVGARRHVRFTVLRDASPVGERVLDDVEGACSEVITTVAIVIAVALDETVLTKDKEKSAPRASDTPTRPPARSPERLRPVAPPEPTPSLRAEIEPLLFLGLLPAPAPGLGLAADAGFSHGLDARLAVLGALAPSVSLADGRTATSLLLGRADGCLRTAFGPLLGRGCLGIMVGRFRASGDGFATSTDADLLWAAPVVRGDARYPLGRGFHLSAALDLAVPLVRARAFATTADGRTAASQTAPALGVVVGFGAGYAFR